MVEKRRMNSSISYSVLMLLRFLTHFRFWTSLWTVLYLYPACRYRFGATSFGAAPFSHLASQKRVSMPLPTVITLKQKRVHGQCCPGVSVTFSMDAHLHPNCAITILAWELCQIFNSQSSLLFWLGTNLPFHKAVTSSDFIWIFTMQEKTFPKPINLFGCPFWELVYCHEIGCHGWEHCFNQ